MFTTCFLQSRYHTSQDLISVPFYNIFVNPELLFMPLSLTSIRRDGYSVGTLEHLSATMLRNLRITAQKAITSNINRTTLRDGRFGYALNPTDFTQHEWRELFPSRLQTLMTKYLDDAPAELLRIEILTVKPQSPDQSAHRDHDIGPRTSLCFALSVHPSKVVGTLVLPGSQNTAEQADDQTLTRTTSQCLWSRQSYKD